MAEEVEALPLATHRQGARFVGAGHGSPAGSVACEGEPLTSSSCLACHRASAGGGGGGALA